MNKLKKITKLKAKLYCPLTILLSSLLLNPVLTVSTARAGVDAAPEASSIGMGSGQLSPIYIKVMQRWANVTDFPGNASQVAIDKYEHDLKQDPQIAPLITKDLLLDLKQFFYEMFVSQEAMVALGKVYAEYYTLDELQDLVNFYQTPVGQKLISTHTEISKKIQSVGDDLLKARERDYVEIVAKYIHKNARSLPKSESKPEDDAAPDLNLEAD